MEADVFPLSSRLVTGPDTTVTLRTGPTVQRNDRRLHAGSGSNGIICDRNAVQCHGVTCAYPRNVGLDGVYTSIYFSVDIAFTLLRVILIGRPQIRLCPQTGLHALGNRIIRKCLQVIDISLERISLAITTAITIIRQEPAKRHIVIFIFINDGTCADVVIVI